MQGGLYHRRKKWFHLNDKVWKRREFINVIFTTGKWLPFCCQVFYKGSQSRRFPENIYTTCGTSDVPKTYWTHWRHDGLLLEGVFLIEMFDISMKSRKTRDIDDGKKGNCSVVQISSGQFSRKFCTNKVKTFRIINSRLLSTWRMIYRHYHFSRVFISI